MNSKRVSVPDEARMHDRDFHTAFVAVSNARSRHVKVRPHRAITPLKVTPYLLAQALVLPVLLCGGLLWIKPMLFALWRSCILFWSGGLELPFRLSAQANASGQYPLYLDGAQVGGPLPGTFNLLVTALLTLLALGLSFRMTRRSLPLKYPVRIICTLQLVSLLYFWLTPASFPYSIARHSEELMSIGYVTMMAVPVMLAAGYYILNQSLALKLLHTALILIFMIVLVPHQVLAQAFIMQHLSVLFMPVLYICFGAVFDALVFVALYSWAVSSSPADATV